ncbi:unnamed protein product [Closterium sp. Naga37s-1]|nr:unnamed protein product [Closterium sp. Naga37s-1]
MYLSRLQPITPFQQILDNVTSDIRASHYGAFYSLYLDPLRRPQLTRGDDRIPVWENQEVNLLTVGRAYGDSLQLWKRAFPRGVIYGIANETTSAMMHQAEVQDPRVRLVVGGQANGAFLEKVVAQIRNEVGLLDFIVDDGGHTMDQQQTSLKHLLPLVKNCHDASEGFISFEAIVNQGTSDKRTHHYGAFYSLYLDPLRLPLQPQAPGDCQQPQLGEHHTRGESERTTDRRRLEQNERSRSEEAQQQQPWEPRAVNMLEIGLKYGDSLKLWKRAFPRGRIYGIDNEMISKKHQAEARDPRVRLMVGDQANGTFLEQVVAEIKSAVRSGGWDKECGEEWWRGERVRGRWWSHHGSAADIPQTPPASCQAWWNLFYRGSGDVVLH